MTLSLSESPCFSSSAARATCGYAQGFNSMETIVIGALALILFGYLLVAILRPEKF